MAETEPLMPLQGRTHEALKWLNDLAALENPNAAFISALLTGTLLESQRIKAVLVCNLAPLMRSTIGRNVAKADILAALSPISDLLGGPPPPQSGAPPAPEPPETR